MRTISLDYLRKRIRNAHPRTRKAQINTFLGLLIKGGGILVSLLLVPLTIDYLSKDTYGTWLTISSIVTMLMFLDIGVGNGLRNKFSEAVTNQNTALARAYVSTAYSIFGIVQLFFICLFLIIIRYVPWQRVFNTHIDTKQLQIVVLLTAVAMAIKLVLDILSYILFALQEASWVGFMTFLTNVIILISTYILTKFTSGNLIYLAAITAISPIIVLLISGFILYRARLKIYRPSFRLVNLNYASSLLALGYKFFVIQIAVVVIFYTDNLIITQLFGPSEVTTYNVAFRYFNTTNTLFAIAIGPYWSAFTEAFVKNDISWMKQTYSYLQKLWLILVVIIIVMIIVANPIYSIWIGNRVTVPYLLNICMGLFIVISCWNSITTSVVNGLGKVRLELYYALVAAIINIPLAIFLGQILNIGSAGVILATCISLLIGSILGTIQAKKLISGTAKGIWNK
jgi:O-antigen/teichoic acid export membrane protein